MTKNIAILFSGSGTNLEAILDQLHGKSFNGITINAKLLICNKPGAPGIQKAQKYGLDATIIDHTLFKDREDFDAAVVEAIMAAGGIDLVVLAGFMRILTPVFTKAVRAINLHPSILPLFKGAHAIDESWQSDMQLGGVTVHWVSSELDGGQIIAQRAFERDGKTRQEWEATIHQIEHQLLPQTIIKLLTEK